MTEKIYVPPLKIQGIKTKLVPFIKENMAYNSPMVWVEPFMGSGVVGFNIAPKYALFSDINPHIIEFYNQIKSGKITAAIARQFLQDQGKRLEQGDDAYYYEVRDRFNQKHNPLDFLFLNRSCFNGMVRFNKNFEFNVPYGHKPKRFSKAYITKIVNQIFHIEQLIKENHWTFLCQSFTDTISQTTQNAFIYCDPPYIGRHIDYYDSWDDQQEQTLCNTLTQSGLKYMLSTWDHNQFRSNHYISSIWNQCHKITKEHFYFVGGKEVNRNSIIEALLMNYIPEKKKQVRRTLFD